MRKLALVAVLIPFAAPAVDITWVPPTAREDSTPLPSSEIAGYRLVWMLKGQPQPDVMLPPSTSYTLDHAPGRVCVTMHTVDTDGLESAPSETVCRNAKPGKPTGMKVR